MDIDKVALALRERARSVEYYPISDLLDIAASLIDSLQAQKKKMQEAHTFWMTEEMEVQRQLHAQLAESQRRERAAVTALRDLVAQYHTDSAEIDKEVAYLVGITMRGPTAVDGEKEA